MSSAVTSPRSTVVLEEARSGRYIIGRASPPTVSRQEPEHPGAADAW
ncbi:MULTISPECIES: hypothetical protein [Streptomyces]|nr:hypothetical protein [Streptomyces melanosporofaciens]